MKFKQIICGVDFSPASVQAFEAAVELARYFKAELHVIHIIEPDPPVPLLALEEKALAAMDALVQPAVTDGGDYQITTEITTGSAPVEILNRARQRRADLIAIGATGVRLLGEGIVGGTAKNLFADAPCTVLTVRDRDTQSS
jgi:nucleotide-binding universal stress UspA family protein